MPSKIPPSCGSRPVEQSSQLSCRVKHIVAGSGERIPLLLKKNGVPNWDATVYVFSEIRARNQSARTIDTVLRAIMLLYHFLDLRQIDLKQRILNGELLTLPEIDSLVAMCRQSFDANKTIKKSGEVYALEWHRNVKSPTYPKGDRLLHVESSFAATRLRSIREFITWLVHTFPHQDRRATEMREAALQSFVSQVNSRIPPSSAKFDRQREGLAPPVVARLLQIIEPGATENPWRDAHSQIRNELIVWWLLHLGIRRGELLGVRISDIDFRSGKVLIQRRADDKGDPRVLQPNAKTRARELILPPDLEARTVAYIMHHRSSLPKVRKHDFLFVASDSGAPLSIAAFAKVFTSLCRHPELIGNHIFAHLLRHTWNDRFSEVMDVKAVPEETEKKVRAYLMGWSEVSGTAATYTRRHIKRKAEAASVAMQDQIFKREEV